MSAAANGGRPRKVLLLAGDQWRAECLSALGHPVVRTPSLDSLAEEGVLFERHYTQASPCGPARASLLTGLYLMTHRSGRNGTPLDERFTNLAREARRAGLRPFLFGYTDTSMDPRPRAADDPNLKTYEGILPGLDRAVQMPTELEPWRQHLRAKGYQSFDDVWDYFEPTDGRLGGPAFYREEDTPTAYLADEVIEHVRQRKDEPWLTYVSFLAPHPPLRAAGRWNELYDPAAMPLPARRERQPEEGGHPFLAYKAKSSRLNRHWLGRPGDGRPPDEEIVRQLRATYYALITETDYHIGRVLQALKDSGQWDDTLIISTVDHGEMLGDRWLVGKEAVFDKAFHIPLIIRDPRREADSGRGRRVGRFTEAVDIMPTVQEWLGLSAPPEMDGLALHPFLEGSEPQTWRSAAHFELDFRDHVAQKPEKALNLTSDQCYAAVLRQERWKYVHFAGLPPLLYDMETDPDEATNLAERPEQQSRLLSMAQELLSFRMVHAERTLAAYFLTSDGIVTRADPRY